MLHVIARALSGPRTEPSPYAAVYPGFLSAKENRRNPSGFEAFRTLCSQALSAVGRRLQALLKDLSSTRRDAVEQIGDEPTQAAVDDLTILLSLPEKGSLLHFEAGNGAFLERFHAVRPQWELSAIESGPAFMDLLGKDFLSSAYNAEYRDADICRRYDMIVVTRELDAMNKPLEVVRWLSRRLTDGGTLYLRQPSPMRNGTSLCGALHGVRIRISALTTLCTAAGLTVEEATTKDEAICLCARKVPAHAPRLPLGRHIL